VRGSDDYRELGNFCGGDGLHHFGAIFDDPSLFILFAHHESGDVLKKNQRHASLATELYEMSSLESGLREEHSIIGQNAYLMSHPVSESADQRLPVASLEFLETAAVYQSSNDLPRLKHLPRVARDKAIEVGGRIKRLGDFDPAGVRRLAA
jgi:hypothetical protein